MSHYGGIWDFDWVSKQSVSDLFALEIWQDHPRTVKTAQIFQLGKVFLEKNATGLKWRMLEIELEKKSGLEKERLIALGIFGLVLFPSQTGLVSLEAAAAYVEYENTQINPVAF